MMFSRLRKNLERLQRAVFLLRYRFLTAVFRAMRRANRQKRDCLFPSPAIPVPYWYDVFELVKPATVDGCFVKTVVFAKSRLPTGHEAVVVEIWDRTKNRRRGWLRIERKDENGIQDADAPADRPGPHEGAQVSVSPLERPRPGTPSSGFSGGPDGRSATVTEDKIPASSASLRSSHQADDENSETDHSSGSGEDADGDDPELEAYARDIVQNWSDPKRDKRFRGTIVATIKYKGANVPTLTELILAANAAHGVESRCWFADSILAILEHVAGPSNFDVKFGSNRRVHLQGEPEGKRSSRFSALWFGRPVQEQEALDALIEEFGRCRKAYQDYVSALQLSRKNEEILKIDEEILKKDEELLKKDEELLGLQRMIAQLLAERQTERSATSSAAVMGPSSA